MMTGPTLDEVRAWPATVSVTEAAAALGISRAHAYELVRLGELPVKVIIVGRTKRVTTASILAALDS